jgi:hypothetical protein
MATKATELWLLTRAAGHSVMQHVKTKQTTTEKCDLDTSWGQSKQTIIYHKTEHETPRLS